jgi:hypothetical protein
MQNAKCKMQNAKCKMQNAECKMQKRVAQMATVIKPTTVSTDYVLAPWHLRARWWVLAGFWRLADLFAPLVEEHPEQQNQLWHR